VTQQFSQMGMGGAQSQPAQQPQQPATQMRLNPLQPVDISMQGQPFHVAELDQPPPPIILPPNVRPSFLIRYVNVLTRCTVLSHAFTACQLPSEVCPINA